MRVCVTGGLGFVGSHIVDALLDDGHVVVVIDNLSTGRAENLAQRKGKAGLRIVLGDLAETRMQQVGGLDAMVHCAALSNVNTCEKSPGDAWDLNVDLTWAAMELAKKCKAERFILTSTGAIYGDLADVETACSCHIVPDNPRSAFARSKLAAELAVKTFGYNVHGGGSIRLTNVYGPRQRADLETAVLAKWMQALKVGATELGVTGDGHQTRDFVFVKDVAARLANAAVYGQVVGGIIASGRTISIRDMAQKVWTAAGREGEVAIKWLPLPAGEVRTTPMLPATANDTAIEDGLRLTWEAA